MATILVVDDSSTVRLLLEKTLVAAGYKVMLAADGRQAINQFRGQPADLVITDVYMPESDGLELLSALRQAPKAPRVIVMSSKTGTMDMLKSAKYLGANLTLQKPFTPADLLQSVQSLLAA